MSVKDACDSFMTIGQHTGPRGSSMFTAPAQPIHYVARKADEAFEAADRALDACAEAICSKILKVTPAPAAPIEYYNNPSPARQHGSAPAPTAPDLTTLPVDAPVQRPYRHDTLWAVPKMWWEMTAGGIGAGTYAIGSATGNVPAMAAGWAATAAGKGSLLLLDLGRPERVWRVFAKPNTSWIARGSAAFGTFAVAGAAGLGLRLLGASKAAPVAEAVATAATSILLTYDGFFLKDSASVSGWQTKEIPWMFGSNAVLAGAALTGALAPLTGTSVRRTACIGTTTAAAATATVAFAATHLNELNHGDNAARLTHRELTEGPQSPTFLAGAGLLGTLAPAALALATRHMPSRAANMARWISAGLAATGVLHMRRSILQSGIHAPVI